VFIEQRMIYMSESSRIRAFDADQTPRFCPCSCLCSCAFDYSPPEPRPQTRGHMVRVGSTPPRFTKLWGKCSLAPVPPSIIRPPSRHAHQNALLHLSLCESEVQYSFPRELLIILSCASLASLAYVFLKLRESADPSQLRLHAVSESTW
jgi:hypothetical protein